MRGEEGREWECVGYWGTGAFGGVEETVFVGCEREGVGVWEGYSAVAI